MVAAIGLVRLLRKLLGGRARDALRATELPGASGRFGHDRTNPIPVRAPAGERAYLCRLRCACGEPFVFHRPGSVGPGPDGHTLDVYELLCRQRRQLGRRRRCA